MGNPSIHPSILKSCSVQGGRNNKTHTHKKEEELGKKRERKTNNALEKKKKKQSPSLCRCERRCGTHHETIIFLLCRSVYEGRTVGRRRCLLTRNNAIISDTKNGVGGIFFFFFCAFWSYCLLFEGVDGRT